jgi:hypothetical protein
MRGRNQNQSTGKSGRGCLLRIPAQNPPTLTTPPTDFPAPPPNTTPTSTSSLPSHTTHLHHHRITNTTNHTTTTNRLCAPTEQAPLTFNVGYNIYRACPIISLSLLNCLFQDRSVHSGVRSFSSRRHLRPAFSGKTGAAYIYIASSLAFWFLCLSNYSVNLLRCRITSKHSLRDSMAIHRVMPIPDIYS